MSVSKLAICGVLLLSLAWSESVRGGEAEANAREILQAYGRKTGLCVVLDCGREGAAGLPAELAAQSEMLVHGLALDEAALARTRVAADAKGLAGRVLAERIELKALPYVNDLVDLLVIEAPAALGVPETELLRVVAPEGALCVRQGGAWSVRRKPRPEAMDDWTHVHHGPDGNMVSNDKLVSFPLGLRWIDGLPKNLNRWASVRGWVISRGRCFALSATEIENLESKGAKDHYLVARNAFNGLPLWKLNCETSDDGAALFWLNAGPLASDPARVYAARKNEVLAVDAESGRVEKVFPTKYPANRLLLLKDVLVAACWEGRDVSKSPLVKGSLWATWVNKTETGAVQAFDARTGEARWSVPVAAHLMLAAGETVYLLAQTGNPPTANEVIALDLASGKERWRLPHTELGSDPDLQLSVAGPGFVVLTKRKSGSLAVLGEADGKPLWEDKQEPKPNPKTQETPWVWTPLVDGLLWHRNQRRDPLTGASKGPMPTWLPAQGCTPSILVGNIVTQSRGCTYQVFAPPGEAPKKSETVAFRAARGACMEGMVPANGMFYTAQNNCMCAPGQILGFLAFGPNGAELTGKEFAAPRPLETGPAFGQVEAPAQEPGWPMYRGNAARSGVVQAPAPAKLDALWRTPLAREPAGALALAWKARLAAPLTAPVAGAGLAVAACGDRGEVLACDAATGKLAWRAQLGARIDSPPTLHAGYCFVGCHDGWLYALRAKDGALAWRTRVAPLERRVVAHGLVESSWPAVGTVLVHGGVLYANAGRGSECDGGVALLALEPATGKTLWSGHVGPGAQRRNDLLRVEGEALCWNDLKLDPKTGALETLETKGRPTYRDPMLDAYLTAWKFRLEKKALRAWREDLEVQVGSQCAALPVLKEPLPPGADGKPAPPPPPLWTAKLPAGVTLNAVALSGARAVIAGAMPGENGGRVWIVDLNDGNLLAEAALPAVPVFDGLALADGRVYIALEDGSLSAWGER
ncbi:MAG: PQQ-binding-like beta-propeller repeat protein [Planctomycetota bacterium]|nr:PQQ-binding-like beta-propeller repeat protein [Planctomycetota bacterium]